jgi:hypothetical protein
MIKEILRCSFKGNHLFPKKEEKALRFCLHYENDSIFHLKASKLAVGGHSGCMRLLVSPLLSFNYYS